MAKIVAGKTEKGLGWRDYNPSGLRLGIVIHVDTGAAGFSTMPVYVSSIGGDDSHAWVVGASAIYSPAAGGFDIYIRYPDPSYMGQQVDATFANKHGWYINWIGYES